MVRLPRLVGVTGKPRCGKDVAAGFLRTRFGFDQYRLSDPLKRGLCAMFNFDYSVWESDEKDRPLPGVGVSPRVLAQTLGTDWGRNTIGEDLWVSQLANRWRLLILALEVPTLVVSDVRFENEAKWIVDNGGVIVKIVRDVSSDAPNHESERGVPLRYIDATVHNDSDVITFLQRFQAALEGTTRFKGVAVGEFE